ncbi:hypothetical protein KQI63_02770 [bacterium]|nr:hypothetical protein [bacterium]
MSSTRDDDKLGIIHYDTNRSILDETKKDGQPRMRIYGVDETCIVLGRGSDPYTEVYLDRAKADGIPLYRRPGGGCSVVLDPGNLVVAATLPVEGLGETKKWFNRCTQWMIDGLRKAGVEGVDTDGVSDLVIGDKKIAGSAVYRTKDILYYAVTILVNADLSLIDKYLPHPPREPEYRAGRSHLDFVASLQQAVGISDVRMLVEKLKQTLTLDALTERTD